MDERRRRACLEAMGITLWRMRGAEREHAALSAQGDFRDEAQAAEPNAVYADWESLEEAVRDCPKCSDLVANRTQTVFGVGNRQAELMVVGEAPGAEEDRKGEPFVGRAGQLLNAMLRAIGLSREEVYIANILKCRPPRNRDPAPEEVANCEPYLRRQLELVRPHVILAVGRVAAQNLLETETTLGRMRGKVYHYGEHETPVIVSYHPAYLLRNPVDKAKAWADLCHARRIVEEGRG